MGMAASQVRFLSLQNRNSDISRQLTMLSNRKLALSRDMNRVSQNYTNALNQTLLKWSNDSGVSYNNLTYDLLMKPNDLNSTLPYIVTDANTGKVVLNNDAILDVNGNTIAYTHADGTVGNLSYIDIAEMISTYSGVTTNADGVTALNFDNKNSVYEATDQYGSNVLYGTSAIDDAYYIPDTTTFSFNNTLRYSIFELLGLVTEQDIKDQNNLLVQLYGSPEAEASGVYPVGSAWGDYYLALANLEAYEAYYNTNQAYTSAATFSGTSTTDSSTITYYNSDYLYSSEMTSAASSADTTINTTITQTNYTGSGAAAHVDTENVVTTNTDGDYYITSNSDIGIGSSYTNSDTGAVYSTTVSNNGITYTYSVDDIWSNALANYQAETGSTSYNVKDATKNGSVDILDLLSKSGNDDGLILVAESEHHTFGDLKAESFDVMGRCIDGFKSILECNNIVDIDFDSIFESAKQSTMNYFYDNKDGKVDGGSIFHSGEHQTEKHAKPRARGHNHIGYSGYSGWHSHAKAYVDVGCLFNTFLTFLASDSVDSLNIKKPEMDYNGDDTVADGTSIISIDNSYYMAETYNDDSSGNTMVNYSKMLSTSSSSVSYTDEDGTIYDATMYITQSDGSLVKATTANTLLYTGDYYYSSEYAADEDDYENMTFVYNTSTPSTWTDVDGTEHTIYGTLQVGDDLYYFESQDAVNKFLSTGDYSQYATKYVDATTLGEDYQNSSICLTGDSSTSKYGYTITGTPYEDEDYHQSLKDDVDKAWDRILDLEDQLENFYSGADKKLMDYYDALFLCIAQNGWVEDERTSSENNSNATTYLDNKLQNYDYFLTVCTEKADDVGYNYTSKMATSVTRVYEVNDTAAQNLALTQYETEKTLISNKEDKIDIVMQMLETEQEAIKTEMDSLEDQRDKNIENTFKIFA